MLQQLPCRELPSAVGSCHATAHGLEGAPTFTNRRLYLMRCAARPFGFFFLSAFATLGVCPLTLPARAKDPCTLPAAASITGCQAPSPAWYCRASVRGRAVVGGVPMAADYLVAGERASQAAVFGARRGIRRNRGLPFSTERMQPTAKKHDDRVRIRYDQLHRLPPTRVYALSSVTVLCSWLEGRSGAARPLLPDVRVGGLGPGRTPRAVRACMCKS